MKLLVALLLATSAEGLNTKQQVALKKPLLLRGGAIGAKTALLVQTAGLTAFGSEFILSKWASTRYWVCARHCTRKPHNCCVTCLRAQCRGLALTRCIDCSLPTLACALIHDCAQRAYCRTMRLRRWLGSSSPRPLVSGFSASRTSPIARPRLATLRRWRPTARSSPTRGLPGRWCASTQIQSTPHHHSLHTRPSIFRRPFFLADACQVAYGGLPHLVRPLEGPGWRLDPVRHPGRHRRHHLPHVGDKRFGPTPDHGTNIVARSYVS